MVECSRSVWLLFKLDTDQSIYLKNCYNKCWSSTKTMEKHIFIFYACGNCENAEKSWTAFNLYEWSFIFCALELNMWYRFLCSRGNCLEMFYLLTSSYKKTYTTSQTNQICQLNYKDHHWFQSGCVKSTNMYIKL